ncbi:TetR/AcrR family transcriptional regulator [Nonomuraea sp. NBC_01738]|uniref:TetR/AcrR family transcriptional regulator n=1 Tax=Nonomuraea sp. NBC_01738 TaxID=2976003 RepID=UPI002E0E181C|nr:TetR/AcrR family transcriptional regulator [Nonomuraea sp. NBC_01738]
MARPPQDPARQLERAHRILDAAAELILRWGYDKTTIDDIARQAGVAKGTIYLHWKTRDALFVALLRRERVATLDEVRQADPRTVRELVRALSAGLLRRPLMRAVLLDDSEVLGRLTRVKLDRPISADGFDRFFGELREHGAIRPELSLGEDIVILSSVIYGFLMIAHHTPPDYRLPDDRLAELLADTAHRALDPGRPVDGEHAAAVARATQDYAELASVLAQRKLDDSLKGA